MASIRLKKKIPGVPAGAARWKIQVPGTHGQHQTKKKNFQLYQQGPQGGKFRSLGHMASIRLKKKNSWCTSRGRQVENSSPWDAWQASD